MGRKRKADDSELISADVASGSYADAGIGLMDASEPVKGSRARKKKATEPEEKRLARFRATCPKTIQERIARVRSQRFVTCLLCIVSPFDSFVPFPSFFMIERVRDPEALRETFKVLGSTGNVYTVTIEQVPKCDCPDFGKGNHCKHLIFVMLKVLNVEEASGFHYQK